MTMTTKLIKEMQKEYKLDITLEEVDITQKPELLQKYPIMSSPGIVIDGQLEFSEKPSFKKHPSLLE